MQVSWPGHIDSRGRLHLADRVRFDAYLRLTLADKRIDLVVTEHGETRSLAQNAWMWGVAYPPLALEIGYDLHEHKRMHDDLLCLCFGTVEITPRLPGLPVRVEPARTTSTMTTKEFSDYMEWLVRYAAMEHHIILTLPDEVPALEAP